MADRTRLGVVLTHPVQYFSPWFRWIAAERPEIDLTVFYAVRPTPDAQAGGFGQAFEWDEDLFAGYRAEVLAAVPSSERLLADRFSQVDAPELEARLLAARPQAVLIPGWHAEYYRRAARVCRAHAIPTIYRGDSTLGMRPRGLAGPVWRARTRARLHDYASWLAVGRRSREYLASFRVAEPLVFDSPHAVDNTAFAAGAAPWQTVAGRADARRQWGLAPAAFVVLFAGKLTPRKRPLDVIRAAAGLDRARVQVLIAGAGELDAACREEARRLGVTVVFSGFLNQRDLPRAYAAADCLALPSEAETWGLVVNEALATGLPCVVADGVGCAPDLIVEGVTGAVVPGGDPARLGDALDAIRRRRADGHDFGPACRDRAAAHSLARATDGLVAALARLDYRAGAAIANRQGRPRVIACCGNMVIAGGLERQTFEVLGALRGAGAACHAVVNTWESGPIVSLAERIGASWSTGYYWQALSRQLWNPVLLARMLWDAARTSSGLVRDARAFGATAILVPEYHAALRNWPGLLWLRAGGARVIMRLGNAPGEDRLHGGLWRWLLGPVVDTFGCNSRFIAGELLAHGVTQDHVTVVYNAATRRWPADRARPAVDARRVIYVGQVIPPKGVLELLEAMALLRRRGVDAHLEVLGVVDGWEAPAYAGYFERVKTRAAQADLSGRVAFLGHREDVLERIAQAAVHCCPSRPEQREGLAGVVLEAKEAGVPSVVTPTGSLPELIEHRVDGWVATAATAEALADGLEHYLRSPAERDRAAAAARASTARFSRDAFARGWLTVFDARPAPS